MRILHEFDAAQVSGGDSRWNREAIQRKRRTDPCGRQSV